MRIDRNRHKHAELQTSPSAMKHEYGVQLSSMMVRKRSEGLSIPGSPKVRDISDLRKGCRTKFLVRGFDLLPPFARWEKRGKLVDDLLVAMILES